MHIIPVITIDGPSGCGKGTIAQLLAKKFNWHFLDSGAIYRAVGWAVLNAKIDPADHVALRTLIDQVKIEMHASSIGDEAKIVVNNHDITNEIRTEACGQMASITSAIPFVRAALLDRQRAMRQMPGLVTDGRDMGTVVFPDASLKFYFLASLEERAKRRFNQLKQKGKHVTLPDILRELQVRDERDSNRAVAPLKPADNVILIDTTHLNVEGVFEAVFKKATGVFKLP
ncbi:MAG: cytidylate kinase [Gammaproteobacteria bacterium RIFCSPHIGHO2_12_FULL_38_11]|nr:MAG: cytidylate kinase [Gammaproteobacteria bacterium RIFCSPHIGHO2_12_FULL_38_11]